MALLGRPLLWLQTACASGREMIGAGGTHFVPGGRLACRRMEARTMQLAVAVALASIPLIAVTQTPGHSGRPRLAPPSVEPEARGGRVLRLAGLDLREADGEWHGDGRWEFAREEHEGAPCGRPAFRDVRFEEPAEPLWGKTKADGGRE
jgi:hypothetical protein